MLCVGITLVAFVVTHLVPGDPAAANLGQRAIGDPAAVQAFRHQYGLDRPLPVQYLLYLKNLLHGNLGISEQSHRPVRTDLAEYIPATIELALFAIVVSMVIGVGLGIVAAVFREPLAGPADQGGQPRRGVHAGLLDRPGGVLPAVLQARLAARRRPPRSRPRTLPPT